MRIQLCWSMLLLCAVAAHADDTHEQLVKRAFIALDNRFEESWAFRETSVRDESEFVASYDPRLPEKKRWILLSVDGREPSAEETAQFRKQKLSNGKDHGYQEHSASAGVKSGTLRLIEETDDHWLFGFVPADEDGDDDFMRHVDGTLKVVKEGHFVEFLRLENRVPIRPAFGVRIKTFKTLLTFGPAAPGGPIVPRTVDVHVQGRAYLAVRFDETETVRYEDFRFVGEHTLE